MADVIPVEVTAGLWTVAALLLLVLVGVVATWRQVRRIEQTLARQLEYKEENALPVVETTAGGAFEAFLNEDPARRQLAKAEQFAAYRKWRQEHGMNWRAP